MEKSCLSSRIVHLGGKSRARAAFAAVLAVGALLVGGPVLAQERSPPERQTLVDLAYAIGESHALSQLCNGEGDQFWRDRMMQLTETEAPEASFDARMKQAFNSGFAARQAQFPSCSLESRKAALGIARKGEGLASRLAATMRPVQRMGPDDPALKKDDPDSVATGTTPR